MSFQTIDLGTQGTQSGDTIRNAFLKVNSNFVDAQTQIDGKADAGHVHDSRYYTQSQINAGFLPLAGGDLTGPINLNMAAGGMGLNLWGNNQDIDFRLGHGALPSDRQYGYFWRYKGTGAGNLNGLELWTEGQTGVDIQVWGVTQDGILDFKVAPKINGSTIGTVHSHPYRSDSWVPAWTDITGKPSSYPPSSHTHSLGEVSNSETGGELIAADGAGGLTGSGKLADGLFMLDNPLSDIFDVTISLVGNGEILQWNSTLGEWINRTLAEAGISAVHSHPYRANTWVPSWSQVTSKPSTFTPSAHNQAISTITGLQTALDEKVPSTSGKVVDLDFDPSVGELYVRFSDGTWWGSGKIFNKI